MFNAIELVNELEDSGMPKEQAESCVQAMQKFSVENLVNKQDIVNLDKSLRLEIEKFKVEIHSDMKVFKAEMHSHFSSFKAEMKHSFTSFKTELQHELRSQKQEIIITLGSIVAGCMALTVILQQWLK